MFAKIKTTFRDRTQVLVNIFKTVDVHIGIFFLAPVGRF